MSLDWGRSIPGISIPGGKGETNMICMLCCIIFDCIIFEFCEMDLMSVVIPIRGSCSPVIAIENNYYKNFNKHSEKLD